MVEATVKRLCKTPLGWETQRKTTARNMSRPSISEGHRDRATGSHLASPAQTLTGMKKGFCSPVQSVLDSLDMWRLTKLNGSFLHQWD